MADTEAAQELENDPRNPCFGCGPANERGLRLSFKRKGSSVFTTLMAHASFQGWPERLHSGILYLAMLETANWTVYGLKGRVGFPVRTSALQARGWCPVGAEVTISGRPIADGEDGVDVEVVAETQETGRLAVPTRRFILPTRSQLLEKLAYERLPDVFEGTLPD